jgi:multiple sugar transport system ATP-binding protein
MAQLSIKQLSKRFGNIQALRGLDLDIADGECFALLGPTGAGKSTLLRCIAGLEAPDGGSIKLDHKEISDLSPAQRDIALVFQQYSLYPSLTVRQNLEFPLRAPVRNLTSEQINKRIEYATAALHIGHLLDRRTDKLSGGEMQRVSIGRAIVREPRIFLLDEPLSNLDAKLREVLRGEIRALRQRLGATMLLVTHDQVEALTMGDRVGVLQAGRLVQIGTPDDVYARPNNTFVAGFVGSPAMNLFEVGLSDGALKIANTDWALPIPNNARGELPAAGSSITLGLRSEDIRLHPQGKQAAAVYAVEHLGAEQLITLELNSKLYLRVMTPIGNQHHVGDVVRVNVSPDAYHCFDAASGQRCSWQALS